MNDDRILFSIENVYKCFPNGTEALSGITVDIFSGQCLLIAGSNGSGKTLLMHMITGLIDSSGGTIRYKGEVLSHALPLIRRQVGLVFQDADAQVVGETVAEDVAFGPKNMGFSKPDIETRVNAALRAVGLDSKRDVLPHQLSGGEKRRLAVAGILAAGADLIIMDEPFANLDWPGVVQVLEIIRNQKQSGKTMILLTHELEKVYVLADRLIILHNGRIHADGSPEEVLNRLDPAWGVHDPRQAY